MKPNEGKLQTGEHILAKIIEDKFPGTKVIIVRFEEEKGRLDVSSENDLRAVSLKELEKETNQIIEKGLEVRKTIFKREEVEKEFDLSKIPESVKEIRIVDIVGFDKRPCRDPHVKNTREIGYFKILKVERKGKDRYRFEFEVD
ncbi:hypothetical protein A3K73_02455 [Candidatus Pacearchaeota archaeon RBG_13_36_9]|nr:MAG: hypothetical protein A3K73_02455 [Candidatus Pacearchaeota archaeon RBG_13_36_9]